mmetsp:Transcript_153921/g.473160  ORF Transcript_153921/g.473160 Transcript_153921/m.473160 type:complete len:110 (-) Transcript_153921:292-621(-)
MPVMSTTRDEAPVQEQIKAPVIPEPQKPADVHQNKYIDHYFPDTLRKSTSTGSSCPKAASQTSTRRRKRAACSSPASLSRSMLPGSEDVVANAPFEVRLRTAACRDLRV